MNLYEKEIVVSSPMTGAVKPLSAVSDPVFSGEVLGRVIAILPTEGRVVAPEDCDITVMFDTGHAVSVTTKSGVEILIHIGIDTIELKGLHYTIIKREGFAKKGETLITFDPAAIAGDGYDIITPIVICNSDGFASFAFAEEGPIREGEPLITLRQA